jgi:DNA-binding response OmpR family regulator
MAARVLVLDPSPEIRELIGHVVRRLSHEPVGAGWLPDGRVPACDLAVVEPAFDESAAAAQRLRELCPTLPIVCVSVYPKWDPAVAALEPVAYVMKPFALGDLEAALRAAVVDAVASPVA